MKRRTGFMPGQDSLAAVKHRLAIRPPGVFHNVHHPVHHRRFIHATRVDVHRPWGTNQGGFVSSPITLVTIFKILANRFGVGKFPSASNWRIRRSARISTGRSRRIAPTRRERPPSLDPALR